MKLELVSAILILKSPWLGLGETDIGIMEVIDSSPVWKEHLYELNKLCLG